MNIPITIWITGLAASGKTTLATRLFQRLTTSGVTNVMLLDGEAVRQELQNFGYATADRNAIGIQKAMMALDYNRRGMHVIVTGIAHHRATRDKIRALLPRYVEVFLDCPVEACIKRDEQDRYRKALSGEYKYFIGVTEPYERSDRPELILKTDTLSIDECTATLFNFAVDLIGSKQTVFQSDEKNNKAETAF